MKDKKNKEEEEMSGVSMFLSIIQFIGSIFLLGMGLSLLM
jgi:hypothetical protein